MDQTELDNTLPEEAETVVPAIESTPESTETDPFAQYDADRGEMEATSVQVSGQAIPSAVFDATPVNTEPAHPENVLAGIVGALLFSLIGGVAYFILYQVNFIAGICGLISVVLGSFGYGLFSGRKNTVKGVIIAIVMTVITLFLAEYCCLSFIIYQELGELYGLTFLDAVRVTPAFLVDPDILPSVISDLAIAYLLSGIASFSTILTAVRANKATKVSAKK